MVSEQRFKPKESKLSQSTGPFAFEHNLILHLVKEAPEILREGQQQRRLQRALVSQREYNDIKVSRTVEK